MPPDTAPVPTDTSKIEAAIDALLAQRATLGDAVVELAVAPLRSQLAALDERSAPDQSLRFVTIVFMDVVGSTSLSQSLDPEDIHDLLDGLLTSATEIVDTFGGRVLQYAGDSLLAVFGHDVSREDDAERAVRAGLALLADGRARGAAVLRDHGHAGFDVRIGVHTGHVLLGGGVDAEGTIRGIAVNIAARLEQAAATGTMRISRDCHRQVRDRFDVEPQPPIELKGLEPMVTYVVVGEKARVFNVDDAADGESPVAMVGRAAELERLAGLVAATRADRRLRIATVVADAGMGKSRLLREFERSLAGDPRVRVLHGRAARQGQRTPFGVVRDLLAWHCDIGDDDDADRARTKLRRVFGAPFGDRADEQSALVGHLVGLDFSASPTIAGIAHDGRQLRVRAFHAFAEYLRLAAGAAGRTVVLLLDDLQWADDGSLDLIASIASACADVPVVIGCFTRPELDERRPDRPRGERIDLAPLDATAGAALVDACLARVAAPPPELRAIVLDAAEGNPFHIRELIGMLVDDRVIEPSDDGWRVDRDRLLRTKVPPTLTAVVQARLDALPPQERRALQQDSVVGATFWDEALRAIAPRSLGALDSLVRRALIERHEDSAFAASREYAFTHHLLHQVTYETVLKAQRREMHRRTAEWLERATGERVGEHLALIADHYERAGDAEPARDWLRRAADAAFAKAEYGAALDLVNRAIALAGDDAAILCPLLTLRLNVHNATGRRAEQADDLARLVACADTLDDVARARAARQQALLACVSGQSEQTIAFARRARALLADADDPPTSIGSLNEEGQALLFLGRSDEAETVLQRARQLAEAADRADLACVALNRLNSARRARGDLAGARDYLEQALAIARRVRNRRFEGGIIGNLGILESKVGHLDRARALCAEGLEISRSIGDRGALPYPLNRLADIALEAGRVDDAMAYATEAHAIARDVGDRACEADALLLIGSSRLAVGRCDEAIARFDACIDLHASVETVADGRIRKADALWRCGRADDATAIVEALLDPSDEAQDDELDRARYFVASRVLADVDPQRADALLGKAHEAMTSIADGLPEVDRHAFVGNLELHRTIASAWAKRGARD